VRGRRILLLLLPLLGLLLTAVVLRVAGPGGKELPSTIEGWAESFENCAGDRTDAVFLMTEVGQSCIYQVMQDGIDAGDLTMIQEGLSLAIEKNPNIYMACHTPGHKAGQYAFAKSGDIVELILSNREDSCQYAFGHGILDGFALAKPDDATFKSAAAACERIDMSGHSNEERALVLGLCADGLGHAAWTSTLDPVAAAVRCGFLALEENQKFCGEGVIMQIYEPAGTAPSGDVSKAAGELPAFCANWPGKPATTKGCHSGAGYVYSRPAWALYYTVATGSTSRLTGENRERMRKLLLEASDSCKRHLSDSGVSDCLESLAQQTPPVVFLDDSLVDEVCPTYQGWEDKCRNFRFRVG
jgi:hypothetical protein